MKLLCFVIVNLIPLFGAQDFRPDYLFHEELDGWLKLHNLPETWDEAMFTCQLEGAMLASPTDSKLLQTMIFLTITGFTRHKSVYTGIHATFANGQFLSIDGIPLASIPVSWAPDEPNNVGGNENCLILHPNGTVADVECNSIHPYICFKKRTNNMPAMNECGTIDRAYRYSNVTGTCHKFHTISRNWQRAFKTCSVERGYLAIVNSPEEAKLLKTIHREKLAETSTTDIKKVIWFLGFRFSHVLGIWLTNQGQTLQEAGYDHWAIGEPNNAKHQDNNFQGEYCGSLLADNKQVGLNDAGCILLLPFICEKEPRV